MSELVDFKGMWEQRFAEVAETYIGGGVSLVPGSRQVEYEDGSTLTIEVQPEFEDPIGSKQWECTVSAIYDYRGTDDAELVSENWNQIEEALGDGINGTTPLRSRIANGRLVIPGGLDAIIYDQPIESEPNRKTLTFTATLGITALN